MNYHDYPALIADAIDIVDSWDLPDADFADAVNAQAKLMAGLNLDIDAIHHDPTFDSVLLPY